MKPVAAKSAILSASGEQTVERLTRQLNAALEDLQGAEMALRSERRKVKALQAELSEKYRQHPNFRTAETIFDFWRDRTGHDRAEFLKTRQKQTLWALKHYTPRECCLAVLGCVHRGHTDPRTRQKYDELAVILRDETMVDKNIERYRLHCLEHGHTFERGPSLHD